MVVTGGCLCKAVRYEIAAEPIAARTCWCRLCQYIGAGSATVNAAFQKSAITISGEVRDYRSVADSGSVMHRSFCPTCGTHLFSEAEPRPHLIFVRAGTLDDPEIARPLAPLWAAEAPSWACFDESIPRIEGQPPPAG
jgi:hypothetical protein